MPSRIAVGGGDQMAGLQRRTIGSDHQRWPARGGERRQHAAAEVALGLLRQRDAEQRREGLEAGMMLVGRCP